MCYVKIGFPWMKATEGASKQGAADRRELKKKTALLVSEPSPVCFYSDIGLQYCIHFHQFGLDIICCVGSQKITRKHI